MQKKNKEMMMMRDMNMIKRKGSILSDKRNGTVTRHHYPQLQHIRNKLNEDDDDDDDDDDNNNNNNRKRGNRDVGDDNNGNRNNYDRQRIIKDDAYGNDRETSLSNRRDKLISKR
jgi:hypothetical protein